MAETRIGRRTDLAAGCRELKHLPAVRRAKCAPLRLLCLR